MYSEVTKFSIFSIHEKILPGYYVNTSKHVGILYETDISVIHYAFVSLNNKFYTTHGT
jgi:hypothetical protein